MSYPTFHLYYLIGLCIFWFVVAFIRQWITSRHDHETTQYMIENTLPMVVQEMMNERVFWSIIHRSGSSQGNLQEQIRNLNELLNNLSRLEIVAFDRRFHYYRDMLHRWDVWGAVYLLNSGCSDDAFADFRSWLIGQGQQKFEAVLKDPEAIVDFVRPGDNWEGLQHCAAGVYHKKTGDILMLPFWKRDEQDEATSEEHDEMYPYPWTGPKAEPKGKEWDEEDLPSLFPNVARVAAK